MKTKVCTKCNIEKSIKSFHINRQKKDGIHIYCKKCCSIYYKKYYQKNKNKLRKKLNIKTKLYYKKNRKQILKKSTGRNLKSNYNISLKFYNNLFKQQNGVCKICQTKEKCKNGHRGIRKLAVDHDHKTKKIRGLLCNNCNQGLGKLKHNLNILSNAIKYLKKNQICS